MFKSMPAQIRKYSPPKDNPLPVAYVIAKCHIPASARVGPILLDPASRSIEKTLNSASPGRRAQPRSKARRAV